MESLLFDSKVVVQDEKVSSALYNRSCFGTLVKNKLELGLVEALYLVEKEKLEVFFNKKKMDYNSFIKKASSKDKRFYEKYKVYRDLRNRGYVVKTALKYGGDYRVYEKGFRPGDEHAAYIVLCTSENETFSWREFSSMVRVAHGTKKGLLVAVVDDEGDVTYYSCGWQRL